MLLSIFSIFVTFLFIIIFSKLATNINFVDVPNNRKIHQGKIPIVGGISIYLTIMFFILFFYSFSQVTNIIFFSSAIILILGLVDDIYGARPILRILIQSLASLPIILFGLIINDLGFYNFNGEFFFFSIIFTLFCILILTNAYNFIDGIDGCCALNAIISIFLLLINIFNSSNNFNYDFLIILLSALIIFFIFNIGFVKNKKIFLGDSGSTFLGFLIAWSFIHASENNLIDPVLVIWCLALPCFDLLRIIIFRISDKKQIHKPDRNHFHHILLRIFNNNIYLTLFILTIIIIFLYFLGLLTINYFGSKYSLLFYIISFLIFSVITNKLSKNF